MREKQATDEHHVVVLAYDRLCTFEFGCTIEVFALERPELDVDWYRFSVCAVDRGPIRAAGGITIQARHGLALLDRADTIVIPGWRGISEPVPEALVKKLRAAHERGARLCSICSGVFVLAAAGLLDGRTVTTHWRYAQALAERYPALKVQANALYVDEGQILTSAGSAAGLDMLLHLVRLDFGPRIANQVAQRLVVPTHRLGDQAQFVPRPMPMENVARLSRLMDWLRAHLPAPHSLATMARHAAMSARTLQRQFQESVGMTPMDWLVRERVGLAKDLLQTSRHSVSRVAAQAGFGSEESFRRHFRLVTGVSPRLYRQQFSERYEKYRTEKAGTRSRH